MSKKTNKAVVLGLSAALALTSLAGCAKKEKETESFDYSTAVATVGDSVLSAGVVNVGVRYYQASLESLYQAFGIDDPFSSDLYGNGTTLGDSAKSQYLTSLTRALLAEQHMADYDLELTDDDKAEITAAAEAFIAANDADVLETVGITQEYVERFLELQKILTMMEPELTADVDTEVSDEEAAQRSVSTIYVSPMSEEELLETLEAAKEAETELETEMLTEAAEDAELETDAAETEALTEETLVTEAEDAELETNAADKTKSEDETEAATEAVTEAVEETEPETKDAETLAEEERAYDLAKEIIEEIQSGEDMSEVAEAYGLSVADSSFGADYSVTALVEATDGVADDTLLEEPVQSDAGGYYVVYLDEQLDRDATDQEKETIVEERKEAKLDEVYAEWEEELGVTTDSEALAEITFEYHLAQPEEEEDATVVEDESDVVVSYETEMIETETES